MRVRRLGATALVVMSVGVTACGPSAVAPDEAARACVLFDACGVSMGGQNGVCVASLQRWGATHDVGGLVPDRELQRRIDCGRTATSCDALERCVSLGHWPDYCRSNPGSSCDGTALVDCSGSGDSVNATDCAAYGMTCAVVGDQAGCVTAQACDPAAPVRCDGNRRVSCDGALHREVSFDCGVFTPGSTCGTVTLEGLPVADCVPPGAACAAQGTRCDGDVLVDCGPAVTLLLGSSSTELLERRYDCAAVFGGRCGVVDGRAVCQPPGSECTEQSPDRCDGTRVEVCVDGAYRATDCASLGFRTCGPNASGQGVGCAN